MKIEEITTIYSQTALLKLLGFKNHKIIIDNKLQGIEIRLDKIKLEIPLTTDYNIIKRIIKKELTKYTHHKSLTPKLFHKKRTNSISKFLISGKIVRQEPLLDLCY